MRLENLTKKYWSKSTEQIILEQTNFNFQNFHSVALCGRSGSGKTTLLSILAGLDTQYDGEYFFDGLLLKKDIHVMAQHRLENIGLISQDFKLLMDRNVHKNLSFPLKCLGVAKREINQRVDEILSMFKLEHLAKEYPTCLSGGEKQRVAIMRTLIRHPVYVIADEPTSELDEETEKDILDIFSHFQNKGTKFLIATHNDKIANHCEMQYTIEHKKLRLK